MAIGFGLRQLLLFYPGRPEAQRAAAKFTLVWAGGDIALALASILLWIAFGTSDIASIAAQAEGGAGFAMHAAIVLLVLTAALKTAAFPLHGWLTEVMEAPTPVSALLHAGIINAGGFLLIRMADLIQTSTAAMAALLMLGGFTALFAAAVMLTQSAIKTALAWSTIAQMGFMLLQCGLGLWTLALLHIRRPLALQGACLPRFRRCREGRRRNPAPGTRRGAGPRRSPAGLLARARALCAGGDLVRLRSSVRNRRRPCRSAPS